MYLNWQEMRAATMPLVIVVSLYHWSILLKHWKRPTLKIRPVLPARLLSELAAALLLLQEKGLFYQPLFKVIVLMRMLAPYG